jgi:hypothetical protein
MLKSPIHWACERGYVKIAKLLVHFDANMNQKDIVIF